MHIKMNSAQILDRKKNLKEEELTTLFNYETVRLKLGRFFKKNPNRTHS